LKSQKIFSRALTGDRCVYDPNLLDALEAAVERALEPIYVDEVFTTNYESLQQVYNILLHPQGTALSLEESVRSF
jgi:hypothetical protein